MEAKISVNWLPIKINEKILNKAYSNAAKASKKVLVLVIATKPCFYKEWSLMYECNKRNIPFIVLNTGQHFDNLLGYGIKEFNFEEYLAVDFQIRGDLSQKSSEMFVKTRWLAAELKKKYPNVESWIYVNGDTISCAIIPSAWLFSTNYKSVQGEAGLRGMSPESFRKLKEKLKFEQLVEQQFNGAWFIDRSEPFPEQWDTFVASAGCQYHFAPIALNKENLVREGYKEERIFVTGNTVVDAVNLKKREKSANSIFAQYPKLEKGEWLRVDIHRRDNLTEHRFKSIINGLLDLVRNGNKVVFVELTASKLALEHYKIRDKLIHLSNTNKNFLFTQLWKEYSQVIEFLESKHCWAIYTDSGSMQEEMNELGKPCLTARFNTDRPETVFEAKSNLLIPPFTSNFVSDNISKVYHEQNLRKKMSKAKKIYGKNVARKTIDILEKLWKNNVSLFTSSHEDLGLWKEKDRMKYL